MNYKFGFHLPTRIEMGSGILNDAGSLTNTVALSKRALLVTDKGIRSAGISDKVEKALKENGFDCLCYDGVEPNPRDANCHEGAQLARGFEAGVIVAVGGGSVVDCSKVIALLQTHGGQVRDYEGRGKAVKDVTPLVAIPTTAGTGSEVTRSAVITDTVRKFKMTVKDVRMAPALAIVDPETTYSLPIPITASTGMDALVHAIEAFTCRAANPISDVMALAAMEKIFPWLRVVVQEGGNKEARYQMMLGSLLAGVAFSHSDVAAVHCMAEALGGLYDTPHGVANSMFLPAVTAYNAQADPARHARSARACGLPVEGLPEEEAASLLVRELEKLSQDIGIPKFSGLSCVNPGDFGRLAEASFINGSTPSNCREIRAEDYQRLFEQNYRR